MLLGRSCILLERYTCGAYLGLISNVPDHHDKTDGQHYSLVDSFQSDFGTFYTPKNKAIGVSFAQRSRSYFHEFDFCFEPCISDFVIVVIFSSTPLSNKTTDRKTCPKIIIAKLFTKNTNHFLSANKNIMQSGLFFVVGDIIASACYNLEHIKCFF